jgi:hypothetical protein
MNGMQAPRDFGRCSLEENTDLNERIIILVGLLAPARQV